MAAPLLAGGALLVGCVAAAVIDPTGGPTICPFKVATGYDCPGCGGTRAAHKLFTGHLGAALDHNVLAVLAMPVILWGLFVALTRAFGGPAWRGFSLSPRWTAIAASALVVFCVVRNLPMAPFAWLGSAA